MPRRFSRSYATFEDWAAAQPRGGPYTARIARTHARYPTATLSQLRRHPRAAQRPLSAVPRAPLSRVPYAQLTARERATRQRALEVVSEARRGKGSLSRLAEKKGIAPKTVRRTSGAFRKRGSRWVATRSDRIQRYLQTYEHGVRRSVLVGDSRTATMLSRYANAVYHYLETGDASRLREFEGRTYVDAYGKIHTFEIDPAKLRAAVERSEADFGQFGDLYAEPEETEDLA